MSNQRQLLVDFNLKKPVYRQVEQTAVSIIEKVIQDNHFFVMQVAHRIKSDDSLAGKIERYTDRFHSLSDFIDLVGIRIIVYFDKDIDLVASAVLNAFDVIEIRDKRKYTNPAQFGYSSFHIICTLKNDGTLPEECCDIRFEIQIRSVLQHAWAEIEHNLGYKSWFGVPPSLQREFSRVASLLETADIEFGTVQARAIDYRNMILEAIAEDRTADLEISTLVLNVYMERSNFIKDYFADLKKKHGIDIELADISRYLEQILWLGVKSLGEFTELFVLGKEYVDNTLEVLVKEYDLDIFTSDAIVTYVMEATLIRNHYSKKQLIAFYSLGYSSPLKAESRAEQILKKMNQLP